MSIKASKKKQERKKKTKIKQTKTHPNFDFVLRDIYNYKSFEKILSPVKKKKKAPNGANPKPFTWNFFLQTCHRHHDIRALKHVACLLELR